MNRKSWIIAIVMVSVAGAIGAGVFQLTRTKRPSTDLLIVSPHPDDAVLCCSGLIQQLHEEGKRVYIATVTDGDGYTAAGALLFHKPESILTSRDMQTLGAIRRKEDKTALAILGVEDRDMTSLGYPDGVLPEVYSAVENPARSPYTGLDHVKDAPSKTYTKINLKKDIESLLMQTRPRMVAFPGQTDTAEDHQVVGKIVTEALTSLHLSPKLLSYATHIATQSGSKPADETVITLSSEHIQKKIQAIDAYETQIAVDGTFLHSFATEQEVFNP